MKNQEIIDWVNNYFTDLQAKAKANAETKYAETGTRELFVKEFDATKAQLDAIYNWLKTQHDIGHFAEIDTPTYHAISQMLSAETLIFYPFYKLCDTFTEKELIAIAEPLYKKRKLTDADKQKLLTLNQDDFVGLRDETTETPRQNLLANTIHRLAMEAAKYLKKHGDRESAMMWLDICEIIEYRCNTNRYKLSLPVEMASELITSLKAAFRRLHMAMRYESIK